jgi:ABC-type Mn2+/Zn2+ transport system permease subunit
VTHLGDLFKPEYAFVLQGLWAGLIVGIVCGYLGVYVVLKRIVFVGAALAEIATVGVAVSFLPIVEKIPLLSKMEHETTRPLFLALLFVVGGILFCAQQAGGSRVPREAMIGVAYAAATTFAIIFLSLSPSGEMEALELIQGNVLTITPDVIRRLLWFAVPIALVHLIFGKEFVLVSFDPEFARTVGYRARILDFLFYLTLGLMIAVSINAVGTLLVFGYLVIPAVAALKLTRRLHLAFFLSTLLAVICTVAGAYVSSWENSEIPMGPAMVAVATVLLVVASIVGAAAGWFSKTRSALAAKS